jgi:hypothetical protein
VRFLGNRAFITTFRNIDPLFAIDLSDPVHPESIGHITLPGFTSYMQLIDQNHLLTIGQNTPGGSIGPTQVSLFDISDLTQPIRIAEYTFEQFTFSEAQIDHHAFGYYADLGLLAIPVSQAHTERVDLDGDGYRETSRIVQENTLAIFHVDPNATDPSARLVPSGEIAHDANVRRSGYIGDKLYSIGDDAVKVIDVSAPNTVIAQVTIASATVLPPILQVNGPFVRYPITPTNLPSHPQQLVTKPIDPQATVEGHDHPNERVRTLAAVPQLYFGLNDGAVSQTRRDSKSHSLPTDHALQHFNRNELDSRADIHGTWSTKPETVTHGNFEDDPADCSAVDEAFDALTTWTITLRKRSHAKLAAFNVF